MQVITGSAKTFDYLETIHEVYTYELSASMYETLRIGAPLNYEGNVSFTITATATERSLVNRNISDSPNNMSASVSYTPSATFQPVADTPRLVAVESAVGYEETLVAINVTKLAFSDNDGSEVHSVMIQAPGGSLAEVIVVGRLGDGAHMLSLDAVNNGTTFGGVGVDSWIFYFDQLNATVTQFLARAPIDFAGTFSVNVSATAQHATAVAAGRACIAAPCSHGFSYNMTAVQLTYVAVADAPILRLANASVESKEDTAVRVIVGELSSDDVDGSEFLNVTVEVMRTHLNDTLFPQLIFAGVVYTPDHKRDRDVFILNGPFDDYANKFAFDLIPFSHLSATVNVSVVAVATDNFGGHSTAATTRVVEVKVDPVANAPLLELVELTPFGYEDSLTHVNISKFALVDTDGSETLTLELRTNDTNVQAVIFGGKAINGTLLASGETVYALESALTQYQTLSVQAANDFSGIISFDVVAIAVEDLDKWSNGDYAETLLTVHMLIFGTADTPTFFRPSKFVSGFEDTLTFVGIKDLELMDSTDESLTIILQSFASNPLAKVMAGGVEIPMDANLTYTIPRKSNNTIYVQGETDFAGVVPLVMVVTAIDESAKQHYFKNAKVAKPFVLHLSPMADKPMFEVAATRESSLEDTLVQFNITDWELTDVDGSESLSLSLISDDENLNGVFMGGVEIAMNQTSLAYDLTDYMDEPLLIAAPDEFSGNVSFVMTATSTERSLLAYNWPFRGIPPQP